MTYFNVAERAENYHKMLPKYPPLITYGKWIMGLWFCGRPWHKQEFYGQYPLTYLKRVRALFPDCKSVLHLFGGIVQPQDGEITFDIDPTHNPTVCGDVREITNYFTENQFDLIVADPPYTPSDFERYGYKPFSKRQCLRDLTKICSRYLAWLDLTAPPFRKTDWNMIGTIAVVTGTNSKVRLVSIFEKCSGVMKNPPQPA